MRYYYVPSSYRGRRFGQGIRGGALRGFGSLARGTLKGGFTSIPAVPSQVVAVTTNPEQQAKVQSAEATGKPVSIGKQLYDLWGSLSNGAVNLAKSGWNKFQSFSPTTKTMAALAGLKGLETAMKTEAGQSIGMKALDLLKSLGSKNLISSGLDIASVANPMLKIPAYALKTIGLGYGGARFKKGSPEAKAYMARLRAMRRKGRKRWRLGWSKVRELGRLF